jgi:hypothetical protein
MVIGHLNMYVNIVFITVFQQNRFRVLKDIVIANTHVAKLSDHHTEQIMTSLFSRFIFR